MTSTYELYTAPKLSLTVGTVTGLGHRTESQIWK